MCGLDERFTGGRKHTWVSYKIHYKVNQASLSVEVFACDLFHLSMSSYQSSASASQDNSIVNDEA